MSLTILFAPDGGHGHLNSCIGAAEVLKQRGHRIIFLTKNSFKGNLPQLGFEEVIYEDNPTKSGPEIHWTESFMNRYGAYLPLSPIDHIKGYGHVKKQMIANWPKNSNGEVD